MVDLDDIELPAADLRFLQEGFTVRHGQQHILITKVQRDEGSAWALVEGITTEVGTAVRFAARPLGGGA